MKKGKKRLYLWLLGIHMFISAFTFGGGYVVVPMIRKYFVLQKKMFGEGKQEIMFLPNISAHSECGFRNQYRCSSLHSL